MSLFAVTCRSLSSSMIQPLKGWPDFTPSTTTTPTPSPSSCTTKWIIGALFYSHVHPPQLPEDARRRGRGVCLAQFRSPPVFIGRGVRISVAGRRGALDPARRKSRSARGAGALGNRQRRIHAFHRPFGRDAGRARLGTFDPRRRERPRAGPLVLVSLHGGGRRKPDRPHAHRSGGGCRESAPALRLRFMPAVRAGLFRR